MADWLRENYGLVIPLLLGAAAVWLLMPSVPRPASRVGGAVAGLAKILDTGRQDAAGSSIVPPPLR